MAMLCKCPDCGHVLDARKGEYGEIGCPECKGWCWIPRSVFDAAPYSERTRAGDRIVDVSFDLTDGYVVTYVDPYSRLLMARSYDPFTGCWRGSQTSIGNVSYCRM